VSNGKRNRAGKRRFQAGDRVVIDNTDLPNVNLHRGQYAGVAGDGSDLVIIDGQLEPVAVPAGSLKREGEIDLGTATFEPTASKPAREMTERWVQSAVNEGHEGDLKALMAEMLGDGWRFLEMHPEKRQVSTGKPFGVGILGVQPSHVERNGWTTIWER
jgi:hypothetical protein